MIERIFQNLNQTGSALAAHIDGEDYTYERLAERVAAIQSHVLDQTQQGEPVGIIAEHHIETYASIYACLLAGRPYVPLNPQFSEERLQYILETAEVKTLLGPASKAGSGTVGPVVQATQELGVQDPLQWIKTEEEELAYILFTSGSTGLPKGVPISHGNLWSFMDAFFSMDIRFAASDRYLQPFELSFDLSVMCYLAPLVWGASFHTLPSGMVGSMAAISILEENAITHALMVPSAIAYMRPYFEEIQLPQLKYSLFCGEALPTDMTKEWMACLPHARVFNVYGPTEATIFCLSYEVPAEGMALDQNGILSIGTPMKAMGCAVVDSEAKEVGQGERGELVLWGPQLTQGYLKNPEKNQAAFFQAELQGAVRRAYRTGDVALQDASGNYLFCGRNDAQVKVNGGYRVELSEVEHYARRHAGRKQVAAVAVPNGAGVSDILLFTEGIGAGKETLSQALNNDLPYYMQPKSIVDLPRFPLNASGKIDRKQMRKQYLDGGEDQTS